MHRVCFAILTNPNRLIRLPTGYCPINVLSSEEEIAMTIYRNGIIVQGFLQLSSFLNERTLMHNALHSYVFDSSYIYPWKGQEVFRSGKCSFLA